jgi:hypothetical protein
MTDLRKKMWLGLSGLLLLAAVLGLVRLGGTDATRRLLFDAEHVRLDSPPILFVGLAYIALQLGRAGPWRERGKGILLGTAFALWGSEAYLPTNVLTTILDDVAMSIFVIDLGLIIVGEIIKPRSDTGEQPAGNGKNRQPEIGQADQISPAGTGTVNTVVKSH